MTEYVTVWEDHEPTKLHWGVPVVRCRNCKHYKTGDAGSYCCKSITTLHNPDGFCAWGELRSDA